MTQNVVSFIEHLSEQPWSNYTAADYTIEQWHNACLIHLHTGAPTSKNECKLPVKTPNGAVNKNGVFAAAAALAGARGGVHASAEQKASAARALRGYYAKMNQKPPPSLANHSSIGHITKFIAHHGVKGMRWGVRNSGNRVRLGKRGQKSKTTYQKPAHRLSDADLSKRIKRMEMEKRYSDLNKKDATRIDKGRKFSTGILSNSGRTVATTLVSGAALLAISKALQKKGKLHPSTVRAITGK
jgi:hypothetical protein